MCIGVSPCVSLCINVYTCVYAVDPSATTGPERAGRTRGTVSRCTSCWLKSSPSSSTGTWTSPSCSIRDKVRFMVSLSTRLPSAPRTHTHTHTLDICKRKLHLRFASCQGNTPDISGPKCNWVVRYESCICNGGL